MSLINDALKRANQFPQPPLVLRETSGFRPVELTPPPSLLRTLLLLILALLAPLSWVVYRNTQTGAVPEETPPAITAQARPLANPSVSHPPSSARAATRGSAPDSSREPAGSGQTSTYPSDTLAVGQRAAVATNETSPASTSPRTHTIKPGETPTSIARLYGIKLQTLLEANPSVNARRLKIGQALHIPSC